MSINESPPETEDIIRGWPHLLTHRLKHINLKSHSEIMQMDGEEH